ncbi:MAG: winged helix-turn-helix domain-containing protein [Ornithinimicrobium sp.]
MPSSRVPDEQLPHTRHNYRDATDDEAKALASGLRLRILRMTLDESLTNKQIADALGKPAASVLHHVRTLVDTGFLAAEDPRRGARGSREIPYRATGKSWYVHAPIGAHSMVEAFLTEVQDVPEDQLHMTRLGLRMSAEDLEEFSERLHALLKEMHDRPRDLSAPPHSLFLAVHPDTSAPPASGPGSLRCAD